MYQLKREQTIPVSIEKAWDFFSSPRNLEVITPKEMGFVIKTELPEKMYSGLLIDYSVRPILGIPMPWRSEIMAVKEHVSFVDEQRRGPYKIWHHEHYFEEVEGGVKMTDIVDYKLPLGFLGTIAHGLFVKKKLESIFDYRYKKVEELFGTV